MKTRLDKREMREEQTTRTRQYATMDRKVGREKRDTRGDIGRSCKNRILKRRANIREEEKRAQGDKMRSRNERVHAILETTEA